MVDVAIAGIVLAAGSSSRFDACDKISAPLLGLPLGLHVGQALTQVKLSSRIVVTGVASSQLPWTGYRQVLNERHDLGLSWSIRLGVAAAVEAKPDGIILVLADMPFVTTDILRALVNRYDGPSTMIVASDGTRRTPPALFGSGWFEALQRLKGDQGARDLVGQAAVMPLNAEHLFDVDRTSDMEKAAQHMQGTVRD